MWGFATVLNDVLVPHLKAIFELKYAGAMLIQFAFFSAYFIFSLPSARLIDWVGYKKTMVLGLFTMGLGALLFVPAATVPSYPLFLGAFMVLAMGITALQVAANPYVAVLGGAKVSDKLAVIANLLKTGALPIKLQAISASQVSATLGFLTYLAAKTRTIRLGTAVCLVPQRNPVYTAKSVVTADWLSGGRVDFGVGIGWLREEFEVLDAPFPGRADRTREYLAVMHACWRDDVSTYQGEHYTLPACRMYPKPIQQPNPPVYFGGETDAALRRVADLGDGWIGFNHLPDSAGASVQRLDRFLADAGRSRADVDVAVGSYLQPVQPSHLPAYRDAGVDQLVLTAFAADPAGIREAIGKLGDEYVGAASRL